MSRNRKKRPGNKNQRISANKSAILSLSGLDNGEIPPPPGGHLTHKSNVVLRNLSIPFARIRRRE